MRALAFDENASAYRCVLSSCAENSIYEVNEMVESCGFEPLGSSKKG